MTQKELLDRLFAAAGEQPDVPLKGVTLGAHVVAVESRRLGLATWSSAVHPVPLETLPAPEEFSSARALARLLYSDNTLESSLGIAALNSLLPAPRPESIVDLNAGDLIRELGTGKSVAVIGHFPFVARLREAFDELLVFEKRPQAGDLEADRIPELLPRAEVVAITATTLCNRTLAEILACCRPDAIKLLVGPSTPLTPALFAVGFDYLAGSLAADPESVRESITRGFAFKQLKGIRHIIIKTAK